MTAKIAPKILILGPKMDPKMVQDGEAGAQANLARAPGKSGGSESDTVWH